jgi:hypothetical protein
MNIQITAANCTLMKVESYNGIRMGVHIINHGTENHPNSGF